MILEHFRPQNKAQETRCPKNWNESWCERCHWSVLASIIAQGIYECDHFSMLEQEIAPAFLLRDFLCIFGK